MEGHWENKDNDDADSDSGDLIVIMEPVKREDFRNHSHRICLLKGEIRCMYGVKSQQMNPLLVSVHLSVSSLTPQHLLEYSPIASPWLGEDVT